jgi:hypothetical protein
LVQESLPNEWDLSTIHYEIELGDGGPTDYVLNFDTEDYKEFVIEIYQNGDYITGDYFYQSYPVVLGIPDAEGTYQIVLEMWSDAADCEFMVQKGDLPGSSFEASIISNSGWTNEHFPPGPSDSGSIFYRIDLEESYYKTVISTFEDTPSTIRMYDQDEMLLLEESGNSLYGSDFEVELGFISGTFYFEVASQPTEEDVLLTFRVASVYPGLDSDHPIEEPMGTAFDYDFEDLNSAWFRLIINDTITEEDYKVTTTCGGTNNFYLEFFDSELNILADETLVECSEAGNQQESILNDLDESVLMHVAAEGYEVDPTTFTTECTSCVSTPSSDPTLTVSPLSEELYRSNPDVPCTDSVKFTFTVSWTNFPAAVLSVKPEVAYNGPTGTLVIEDFYENIEGDGSKEYEVRHTFSELTEFMDGVKATADPLSASNYGAILSITCAIKRISTEISTEITITESNTTRVSTLQTTFISTGVQFPFPAFALVVILPLSLRRKYRSV